MRVAEGVGDAKIEQSLVLSFERYVSWRAGGM